MGVVKAWKRNDANKKKTLPEQRHEERRKVGGARLYSSTKRTF